MLVALTGATGFIGSYAAAALHKAGHRVHALVRSTSHRDHIVRCVNRFIEGDVADPQALAALVAGVDCVIHAAIDGDAYERSPTTHFRNNVVASLELLEAARLANVGQFIFVSSTGVYAPELPPIEIDENSFPKPTNLYGAYKLAVETNVITYHPDFGMNASVFRPATVYGIDRNFERCRWLDLVRQVKANGTIDVPDVRRITHITDVADALTFAVGDQAVAGQTYNLVDCYFPWQTAAEIAKELTGSSATIVNSRSAAPLPTFNTAKARAFFSRHGNTTALTRGVAGVRDYIADILRLV